MRGSWMPGVTVNRRSVLDELRNAERSHPDRPLVRWPDGEWTVREFAVVARGCAAWLRDQGVSPGSRVAVYSQNSQHFLALWYGIYLAGAVEVPVNAELKGPMLAHVLDDSEPTLVRASEDRVDRVHSLGSSLPVLLLDDEVTSSWSNGALTDEADPGPTDLATVMYTSGTTGPSKGVMLSHGYYPNLGEVWRSVQDVQPEDVSHFSLPMFHVDAHVSLAMAIVSGSVFGFVPRFSASRFWDECAALGSTWFVAVGSMFAAIARHDPPAPGSHRIRRGVGAPIPPEAYEFFEDGLGIPLCQLYGQTEADGVCFETVDRRRRGCAGWPSTGFDVAIVDDDGREVGPGELGEITYRPGAPNMVLNGYWKRPDATAEASKDMWFHSGDLGWIDADGFLWFKGRKRDSLRRRGENISAYELERTVRAAPGIAECVAVAVKDELGGEDEVKVFVTLEAGAAFDAAAFFEHCEQNLAKFAVPRFVEVVDESALTRGPGTGAVQKHLLPAGNGPATIDRSTLQR
jgi:crotonobetaine/carnitine-CoA ligase